MRADTDLLASVPSVHRQPFAARLRRLGALALALAAMAAITASMPRVPWSGWNARPAVRAATPLVVATGDGRDVGTVSDLLDLMIGVRWELLELAVRPDAHGVVLISARFEAPPGGPALPGRLLAQLADPSVDRLSVIAITATASGTSVDVAGRMRLDDRPRRGSGASVDALPGVIAELLGSAGARVRGIRVVEADGVEGTAYSVAFDADPNAAVAALEALEEGPSAPTRMTTLLVRRIGHDVGVDLVMTARRPRGGAA